MPYPKKRAQIFLDDSSSYSDQDDDDEDNSNGNDFNSDDFDSDSDSDSEDAKSAAAADDGGDGDSIRKASETKKKTPSMVLPSENDEDQDVALVPMYTQEPSPRSKRYSKRDTRSRDIHSERDSLAAVPETTSKKRKENKATSVQRDGEIRRPNAKRSRLKLNRSSKKAGNETGSQEKDYNSDSTYKSVKVVLGGDSEREPIVLDGDDEDNDDTDNNREKTNKKIKVGSKGDEINETNSNTDSKVAKTTKEESKIKADGKSKKKGKGSSERNSNSSTLKAPPTPNSVATLSPSSSVATKAALLTQKPLSTSSVASMSSTGASTSTKHDFIAQKPMSQSTVISSSSSISSPASTKHALITQKPLSQASSTSSVTTTKSATKIKTITPNKPSETQSKSNPKPKKKQNFQSQVLSHLLTTLRPFTLKSLATELRTTSVALHHLMLSMVDKGIVQKREWGKNKNKELYWIDIPTATKALHGKEEYNAFEDVGVRESAKAELAQLKNSEMALRREIETVQQEVSNDDLEKKLNEEEKIVSDLTERVNGAKDRIESARRGHATDGQSNKQPRKVSWKGSRMQPKPVPMKTSKQIKKEFNQMRIEWKNRKEKCVDFIDNLSDAMEKKPKEVIKLLDIETDEAMGVKLPPKHAL